MIIAVFNACFYIIWEKCLTVILMWRNVSIQDLATTTTQHKNHVLLISDKFSYEGNLSFLHKTQEVKCLGFNSLDGVIVFIDLRFMHEIQSDTKAVGSDNWHEKDFYQCISMSSYKC